MINVIAFSLNINFLLKILVDNLKIILMLILRGKDNLVLYDVYKICTNYTWQHGKR